jgi:TolB protein
MSKLLTAFASAALLTGIAAFTGSATPPGTNGRLVFTAQVGPHTQLFTIGPGGNDLTQVTHFKDGSDALNANWSPDGKRIAFERDYPYPHAVVETMNADGGDLRLLTPKASPKTYLYDSIPVYSPDGKRLLVARNIAYTEGNNGPRDHTELVLMTLNGRILHRVTPYLPTGPNGDHFPAHGQFSPDGKQIVYVKKLGRKSAGFVINVNGSGLRQVTPWALGVDDRIDWSPDGSLILFSNAHDDAHGIVSNVYTIRPDGTGLTQITHERKGSRVSDKADSWSPDGKQIMFVRDTGPTSSLYAMNADGSEEKQLTHGLDVHGGSWGTHP